MTPRRLSKRGRASGRTVTMWHGTPSGGFSHFKGPAFFAPTFEQAAVYTRRGVGAAQATPLAHRGEPEVLEVEVTPGRVFDLSTDEGKAALGQVFQDPDYLARERKMREADPDYFSPTMKSVLNSAWTPRGFDRVQALPYGLARWLGPYLGKLGYDSMLVGEGSFESLYVLAAEDRTRIVGRHPAPGRTAGAAYPSERSRAFERKLSPDRQALAKRFVKTMRHRPRWATFYEFVATAPIEEIERELFGREREHEVEERKRKLAAAHARREERRYEGAVRLDESAVARKKQDLVDKLVWLYHGTTSKKLRAIKRDGLCPSAGDKAFANTTEGYVYLTVDSGGVFEKTGAAFYARNAARVFGGDPVILRVAVPWNDLEPDEDDADLDVGAHQYRYAHCIWPKRIAEVIKV